MSQSGVTQIRWQVTNTLAYYSLAYLSKAPKGDPLQGEALESMFLVLVLDRLFQPNRMFVGEAGAYPSKTHSGVPVWSKSNKTKLKVIADDKHSSLS